MIATGNITPKYFFEYNIESGKPLEKCMREMGWDFSKFHREEGIYTIPWLQGTGRYRFVDKNTSYNTRYELYLKNLKANTSTEYLKTGDGEVERMVMVDYGWEELERCARKLLPKLPHWHVPYQYTMEGAAQGFNALRPFLQATAAIDPDSMLYGFSDANLIIGNEQPLREFAQFLRSLPKAKFKLLDSKNKDLIVRTLSQDGKFLFYALNPTPWPVKASIKVDNAGKIKNLISGKTSKSSIRTLIPAYHGVSFEASGKAVVSGWKTSGTGEMFEKYLKHMEERSRITEDWLKNDKINSVLLPDQKKTMRTIMGKIDKAMVNQRYAEVWQLLNSWDFIWCSYFLERQNNAIALITEKDMSPADLKKKMIKAVKTNVPPIIDGKLDDKIWQEIKPQSKFIDKDGKTSGVGTLFRVAWDDENLYLAFECKDNFPDQLKTDAEVEKDVMKDDCVVFLLQPNMKNKRHFQMALTAAGVRFDQKDYDYSFAPTWQAVTKIGTKGWTAEIAFPFKALEATPESGEKWGANFCRIFRKNKLPWSTWNYVPTNWHDTDGYGRIEFE